MIEKYMESTPQQRVTLVAFYLLDVCVEEGWLETDRCTTDEGYEMAKLTLSNGDRPTKQMLLDICVQLPTYGKWSGYRIEDFATLMFSALEKRHGVE